MRTPKSRDFGLIRAYLDEQRHPLAHRALPMNVLGPLIFCGVVFLGFYSKHFIAGWMVCMGWPFLLALAMGMVTSVSNFLQKPRNDDEARRVRAFETAQLMCSAFQRKQVNPMAARMLEGCAFHRSRVLRAVEAPGWESSHWRGMRDQAVEAADEGLQQALEICSRFTGPGFSRSKPWKDFAEDVADGKLGGALKSLQKMLESDQPRDIIDRRDLPSELWPVYDIAIKLQQLASEMEQTANKVNPHFPHETSRLDQVLSDLSAMRKAEQELEADRVRQF